MNLPTRRSARLLAADSKGETPQSSTVHLQKEKTCYVPSSLGSRRPFSVPNYNKAARARMFWYLHKFNTKKFPKFRCGPEVDVRTCVLSSGRTFHWQESSSGHTWIAVNGVKAHCVMVMNAFPEYNISVTDTDLHPPVHVLKSLLLTDMHTTASAFDQKIAKHAKRKPFAVVSVAPGTVEGGYERAIEFLEENLKDRSALTYIEMLKIAYCAVEYLFGPKFNPELLEKAAYEWGAWEGHFGKARQADFQ